MLVADLDEALEALLLRLVPGLADTWVGASKEEIALLERLSGTPLPPFHRWFLSRMGRSVGTFAHPKWDFTAQRLVESYTSGDVEADGRYVLLGREFENPVMETNLFFDLAAPKNGDALVVPRLLGDRGAEDPAFETFREMLAWHAVLRFRVASLPTVSAGTVDAAGGRVYAKLTSILAKLGFGEAVPAGPFSGAFEREDMAFAFSVTPLPESTNYLFFRAGATRPPCVGCWVGSRSSPRSPSSRDPDDSGLRSQDAAGGTDERAALPEVGRPASYSLHHDPHRAGRARGAAPVDRRA
jgi:hypothetical protein